MTDSNHTAPPVVFGLSARLLLLTVLFVMLAEFLIYAPSVSRYRKVYFEDKIAAAHLATLALEATPDHMVSRALENELLDHVGAYGVVLNEGGKRMLALRHEMPPAIDATYNVASEMFVNLIWDAFSVLARDENRVIRVVGPSRKDANVTVEVVFDEGPMHMLMVDYSTRILQLSIVISLITAGLVYLSLHLLTIRPMRRITQAMTDFRARPEDKSVAMVPSSRTDEVGIAERELAAMQEDLRGALKQKDRLAALGSAVAKVNHDLRNSLATAVLVSDRLANIQDPEVKKVTPRLFDAIDRAVNLCSQTLNYVRDTRPQLDPQPFFLRELIVEVASALRHDWNPDGFRIENQVPMDLDFTADRDHLYRGLFNLATNARQAGATTVTMGAKRAGADIHIDVADDGPGLPDTAQENLFQPFKGSTTKGGSGLGLVIVRDVLRAHGGTIELKETSASGTVFRLTLPAGPDLSA